MASESAALYATSLIAGTAPPDSTRDPPPPPAVSAAVSAPLQVPEAVKAPEPASAAPHAMAAAAAAAFSQYPPGMVFTSPDTAAVMDDQPTYVNPKQYARILKRRESRKKQTGTDVTSYTPRKRSYMHESRHKHAMARRRGPGGRFLSKEEREELAKKLKEQDMARIKEPATAGGQ